VHNSLSIWLSIHSKEEVAVSVGLVASSWNIGQAIRIRLTVEPQIWKAQINDGTA
jgi:hypothetical protein